jgi:hypothetical protein
MGAVPEIHACPKCGRLLFQSGEAVIEGVRLPVFRCDECRVQADLVDEREEAALTFTLDEDGQLYDAAEGWRWA